MSYVRRVSVSYGDRTTRLEKLRAVEAEQEAMAERLRMLEELWLRSDQTMDDRRNSSTAFAVTVLQFAKQFGWSQFAEDRANDLCVALGELLAGRTSTLLRRANVPTRTPAATDQVNQAIAQVCVDAFREAGLSAKESWERTARIFNLNGFKNFSVSKIKSLGSRFTGAGASMDPAFGEYQMIKGLADSILTSRGVPRPLSDTLAYALAKQLVSRARAMDHRLAA